MRPRALHVALMCEMSSHHHVAIFGRLSGGMDGGWDNQDELSPHQYRDRILAAVTLEKKLML